MPTASFCPAENGVWKVLPPQDFARDVAGLFQRLRASFSSGKVASVVDTLKLIIPQQEAPSRRLIGFRRARHAERHVPPAQSVTLDAYPVRCGSPAGGR